jgi:hypothetical protein
MMFKVKDEVVVRKRTSLTGPPTNEVKVGTVMAVSEDQKKLTVSLPRPGGMHIRETVPVENCSPVSEVFRRNSVQANPAFRQLYKGPV